MMRLFCKHEDKEFIRNLYGDEINYFSTRKITCRSLWRCRQCGKVIPRGLLGGIR